MRGCYDCKRLKQEATWLKGEVTRLEAIAEAAMDVFGQREAGVCIDARQVGWEHLEETLRTGNRTIPAEAKELTCETG